MHKASKAFYIDMHLPVVKDREMHLLGEGFDRMKINGSIVIVCRSIHNVWICIVEFYNKRILNSVKIKILQSQIQQTK